MTLERLREICRALPDATEDIKWQHDLCFLVGGKMFAAVNLEPPHQLGFKCTPDTFAELVEREGIIPAPYLARAMWLQESVLGEALDVRELTALIRSSYDLVVETLPRAKRPSATSSEATRSVLTRVKAATKLRAPLPKSTTKRRVVSGHKTAAKRVVAPTTKRRPR